LPSWFWRSFAGGQVVVRPVEHVLIASFKNIFKKGRNKKRLDV